LPIFANAVRHIANSAKTHDSFTGSDVTGR
jgi:hypothetical protein